MISLGAGLTRLCDGFSRREFLRLGALGTLGLGLPQLLEAADRVGSQRRGRATSCILFFLKGGQSQIETFDMKPEAPLEYLGITLANGRVMTIDIEAGDDTASPTLIERVSFSFSKISVEYTPQGPDGSADKNRPLTPD